MSKVKPQATTHTQHAEPQTSVLDATIEATGRHKSIVRDAASILGVDPGKLCDLLRNVWKTSKGSPPLTDAEMFKGLSLIARYELDPIAKEVYVTRDGKGRLLTIIGIDGWIKVLNRTEHYDGFEWDDEVNEKQEVVAVNVRIYSKERSRPTTYRGLMREYQRVGGLVARDMPVHMLRLFSLRHAARLFTPIGGDVLTEEEARYMQSHDAGEQAAPNGKSKTQALADRLMERMSEPTPDPEPERTADESQETEEAPESTGEPEEPQDWYEACAKRVRLCRTILELQPLVAEISTDARTQALPAELAEQLANLVTETQGRLE